MKSINIIGAGKLGKVIGEELIEKANLKLLSVLNKNFESTINAVKYFNSGNACKNFNELKEADIWMIAVLDDEIGKVVKKLLNSNKLKENNIVFHCSGSLSSSELLPIKKENIFTASIHPIKSFIGDNKLDSLHGVHCSIEGDNEALAELRKLLTKVGFETFEIKSKDKMLYHTGCVFTCNYLTTLFELGLTCFKASGIGEVSAKKIIAPLVQETIANNLNNSSLNSLSGPIKRGDYNLIKEQLTELKKLNIDLYNSYKILGKVTLGILKEDKESDNYRKITELFE